MRYLKNNFHDVLRLYINQIGITIFSLMLYVACGFTEDDGLFSRLRTAVSVFSVLFYFVLLYFVTWEEGAKDKIRIDSGRIEPRPYRGFLNGLLANIPNVILSVVTLFLSVFCYNGAEWSKAGFSLMYLFTSWHSAMYMGIIQTSVYGFAVPNTEVPDYGKYLVMSILFLVVPLVSSLVTHLGYALGSREKKIFGFLSSKKK